jgi:hypothetical protein
MRERSKLALVAAICAAGCGRFNFDGSDTRRDAPPDNAVPGDLQPDSAAFDVLIADSHLVAYWKLDDTTFADSSTYGNAIGSCYMACPTLALGLRGMAADFHDSEGLEVGTVAPLSSLASAVTLAAWVKLRSITAYAAVISNDRDCSNCQVLSGFSLWASITGAPPSMLLWNQSQQSFGPADDTVLPTGTWVFLAGTYDGQTARLFVDGALQSSLGRTNAIGTPHTFPLRIGHQGFDFMGGVDGLIDEVMIFDRALTTAEIQTIYQALKP